MNAQEAKKLENKVIGALSDNLKKKDIVILGISGGPDSMLLLHIFEKFIEKTQLKIVVAHINHKLRKKESDLDEEFIKEYVEKTNNSESIVFSSTKKDVAALSKKNKKGLEEMGRKIRYEFFAKLQKKYSAKFVVTAHHADDNLETIILNLTRGSSLKGLSGMQLVDPPLFRPLLDLTKKQILEYLKLRKIPYRKDKTNNSKVYTRNKIRHDIISKLQEINPNLSETIAKNAKLMREAQDFLEEKAKSYLKTQSTKELDAKSFRKLHPALQKTVLRELYLQKIGNTKNLENIHTEEALTLINSNIGNKKKKFGKLSLHLNANKIKVDVAF